MIHVKLPVKVNVEITEHHRYNHITVQDYKFHMTRQSNITDISRTITVHITSNHRHQYISQANISQPIKVNVEVNVEGVKYKKCFHV